MGNCHHFSKICSEARHSGENMKKFLIVEKDDDCPILLEADTEEELARKLYALFKEGGYCDTVVMTREEYQKMMEDEET